MAGDASSARGILLSVRSASSKELFTPRALKSAFQRAKSFSFTSKPDCEDQYARGIFSSTCLQSGSLHGRPASAAASDASELGVLDATTIDPRKLFSPLELPDGAGGTHSSMLSTCASVQSWGLCERHDHCRYGAGFQEVVMRRERPHVCGGEAACLRARMPASPQTSSPSSPSSGTGDGGRRDISARAPPLGESPHVCEMERPHVCEPDQTYSLAAKRLAQTYRH